MDVYEAVIKRRSVRKFKDLPVAYDVLEKCVNAARLAPTAMNSQVCEYVIVDDEQLLPQVLNSVALWAGVPRPDGGWSAEGRPKAYIVTLIDTGQAEKSAGKRNADYDAALAVENMVLVAQEEELGSCVITGFDRKKLRQSLSVPEKYDVAIMLALGYPDESPVVEVSADLVKRWTDANGVLHVPKKSMGDVLHRNRFSE